jgi:hypothetical protein
MQNILRKIEDYCRFLGDKPTKASPPPARRYLTLKSQSRNTGLRSRAWRFAGGISALNYLCKLLFLRKCVRQREFNRSIEQVVFLCTFPFKCTVPPKQRWIYLVSLDCTASVFSRGCFYVNFKGSWLIKLQKRLCCLAKI